MFKDHDNFYIDLWIFLFLSIQNVIGAINEQMEDLKFESEDLYADEIEDEKEEETAER